MKEHKLKDKKLKLEDLQKESLNECSEEESKTPSDHRDFAKKKTIFEMIAYPCEKYRKEP